MIRSFSSFMAAASEAALSRIFAGQYTMIDLVAGRQLGRYAGTASCSAASGRRRPARAEKGALPLTGAPGEDGPGGGRSGHRVEAVRRPRPPRWAAGRPIACSHRRCNEPARVNLRFF